MNDYFITTYNKMHHLIFSSKFQRACDCEVQLLGNKLAHLIIVNKHIQSTVFAIFTYYAFNELQISRSTYSTKYFLRHE
jgi:hypothetical protein